MVRNIRIIHGVLGSIVVVFGTIVLWINYTNPVGQLTEENQLFLFVPAILLIIAFPVSSILFKTQLRQRTQKEMSLESRVLAFQSAHMVRMALFELPGLVAVLVCFLTANNYNMITMFIVLMMFLFLAPNANGLAIDLNLDRTEKERLVNG